jgi:hypothetical protein
MTDKEKELRQLVAISSDLSQILEEERELKANGKNH